MPVGVSEEGREPHREPPDPRVLGEVGDVLIKDEEGKEIPLKSLYMDKPGDERQLLIFVRHFHCGVSACSMTQATGEYQN